MEIVRPCLALTALVLTASPSLADEVLGTWLRDNGALQVKFEPCGDAICGNIVWVKPGSDSKAKVGQRSSACSPPAQIPGPAKPPILTADRSIQAKCLLKDLPSAPRAASSVP
jgi:hypothetical protein